MKKLISLRAFLAANVPDLAANPDKLLVFAEKGSVEDWPRTAHHNFETSYTATLVVTEFSADPDTIFVPLLAWLKENQPDRAEREALTYEAEILSNNAVDLEIKVELKEFVLVTREDDNTVTTQHLNEPLPADGINPQLSEWAQQNGG